MVWRGAIVLFDDWTKYVPLNKPNIKLADFLKCKCELVIRKFKFCKYDNVEEGVIVIASIEHKLMYICHCVSPSWKALLNKIGNFIKCDC
jgi:hypothetical protein